MVLEVILGQGGIGRFRIDDNRSMHTPVLRQSLTARKKRFAFDVVGSVDISFLGDIKQCHGFFFRAGFTLGS